MSRYLLALGIIICAVVSADAASLFGKVIDVSSGDVITIYNLNRPVRVKLMGVAAPELNQAFGDVAKKHLVDLVFEKSVVVEYAGIASDGSLTGRVLLNDADVGAQMIRDGAAWFDLRSGDRLNATNKEVYQQSEQAARNEKRGLWQQENPVAPWEFAKAEKIRRNAATSLKEIVPAAQPRRSGPTPELNNLTLMAGGSNSVSAATTPDTHSAWARSAARKNWSSFQPTDENFSVEIPEDGERETISAPMGNQTVDLKTYTIRDGWAVYSVAWFKLTTVGETDQDVVEGFARHFMERAAESYQQGRTQGGIRCRPVQKSVSQNGYLGIEFYMPACPVPTLLRMYTKIVDDQRLVYMGVVAYKEDEIENVSRFLKSFTVGTPKTRTR